MSSNTRSGRLVKKVGQSESKQGALASLAKARKGEGRRIDEYEADEGKNNQNFQILLNLFIFLGI